jgi:general secretion pathway protein G
MRKNINKKSGFTIIEMLVVIAVIAMLISVVLTFWSDSKKKVRDSRREEDIKEIQNALNLYASNNHIYPVCSQIVINGSTDCLSQPLIAGEFMSGVPTDPLGGSSGTCGAEGNYVYCYTSDDGFSYILEYALETDNVSGKSAGWQSASP